MGFGIGFETRMAPLLVYKPGSHDPLGGFETDYMLSALYSFDQFAVGIDAGTSLSITGCPFNRTINWFAGPRVDFFRSESSFLARWGLRFALGYTGESFLYDETMKHGIKAFLLFQLSEIDSCERREGEDSSDRACSTEKPLIVGSLGPSLAYYPDGDRVEIGILNLTIGFENFF